MNNAAGDTVFRIFKIQNNSVRNTLVNMLIEEQNLVQILKGKKAVKFLEDLLSSLISHKELQKNIALKNYNLLINNPELISVNKESFMQILYPYLSHQPLINNMGV